MFTCKGNSESSLPACHKARSIQYTPLKISTFRHRTGMPYISNTYDSNLQVYFAYIFWGVISEGSKECAGYNMQTCLTF